MQTRVRLWVRTALLAGALQLLVPEAATRAQTAPPQPAAAARERDGQHDFDFAMGSWKIHLSKLEHPFSGSNKWIQFDGTLQTHKIWDGLGNVEEVVLNSPSGIIKGLAVRIYNPQTHQWAIYWANSKNSSIDPIPQIGQFKDGLGAFYGQDTYNGKLVYVRFLWSKTDTSTPHFEQSFSNDGGKTWEVNWVTDQTRVSSSH